MENVHLNYMKCGLMYLNLFQEINLEIFRIAYISRDNKYLHKYKIMQYRIF